MRLRIEHTSDGHIICHLSSRTLNSAMTKSLSRDRRGVRMSAPTDTGEVSHRCIQSRLKRVGIAPDRPGGSAPRRSRLCRDQLHARARSQAGLSRS
jgi:hypothetical protein